MTLTFVQLLLVVIAFFGVYGSFRGVRAGAMTTGAIFFALVVVLFAGTILMQAFGRVGLPLTTPDTQAVFQAVLFIFTTVMASIVLRRIANVPVKGLPRHERFWGLLLGLLNGFFVMTIVSHYLSDAFTANVRGTIGVPSFVFDHPSANTWSLRLEPSALTLLPPTPSGDLWAKLPLALVLLLLFLAFVFVGTVYKRVSGSRG